MSLTMLATLSGCFHKGREDLESDAFSVATVDYFWVPTLCNMAAFFLKHVILFTHIICQLASYISVFIVYDGIFLI